MTTVSAKPDPSRVDELANIVLALRRWTSITFQDGYDEVGFMVAEHVDLLDDIVGSLLDGEDGAE